MCAGDFTNVQPISFRPLLSRYGQPRFTFKYNQDGNCGRKQMHRPGVYQHHYYTSILSNRTARETTLCEAMGLDGVTLPLTAPDKRLHNRAISPNHNQQYMITSYKFKVNYIKLKC